jgi:GDP-L-fucose synthase
VKVAGATVIVTGGRGFLGRHLCDELSSAGARVAAVGRADFDLRHRGETDRMLAELRPDAVVHLAAVVGGIGANRAEPGRFLYENAVMGLELLESCRRAEVEKVLVAGSVCAYPKFTPVPFREEDLWNGYPEETNAPYGLAKKLLLVQAQTYRDQYGMTIAYLLPTNLYGPYDNFDLGTGHVIPSMIRKFIDARDRKADTVELWGDGSPTREFLFVRDAARAFRLALERYEDPEPVNVGSGTEISIRDLAGVVAEATGFTGTVRWDATHPNGQPRRRLAVDRAWDWFGFRAETDFAKGIDETVAWYEEHGSPASRPH